jgi:ATP-dependent helicase/nuclease subunit B
MGDITLHVTPYGRPAAVVLHGRVAAAKADDPLQPVTVVVPTNYVGVSARRTLAGEGLGPLTARGVGVAGLNLLTVYRLAELLGAPRLAASGRRPVSTPVIAAAIRSVLAEAPGIFAEVRDHPSTEEALVRSYRELSELPERALDALAAAGERAPTSSGCGALPGSGCRRAGSRRPIS